MAVLHVMGKFWMAVLIVSVAMLLTYKFCEHMAGVFRPSPPSVANDYAPTLAMDGMDEKTRRAEP